MQYNGNFLKGMYSNLAVRHDQPEQKDSQQNPTKVRGNTEKYCILNQQLLTQCKTILHPRKLFLIPFLPGEDTRSDIEKTPHQNTNEIW